MRAIPLNNAFKHISSKDVFERILFCTREFADKGISDTSRVSEIWRQSENFQKSKQSFILTINLIATMFHNFASIIFLVRYLANFATCT